MRRVRARTLSRHSFASFASVSFGKRARDALSGAATYRSRSFDYRKPRQNYSATPRDRASLPRNAARLFYKRRGMTQFTFARYTTTSTGCNLNVDPDVQPIRYRAQNARDGASEFRSAGRDGILGARALPFVLSARARTRLSRSDSRKSRDYAEDAWIDQRRSPSDLFPFRN